MHDIEDNLGRAVKIGKATGEPEVYTNGYGQGVPLSLIPALAFVSIQFSMVTVQWPKIKMGAVIDDRNFRGDEKDVGEVYQAVDRYDTAAGQTIEHESWQGPHRQNKASRHRRENGFCGATFCACGGRHMHADKASV